MSGILTLLPGVVGTSSALAVRANNVTGSGRGVNLSGFVTTKQLPNTYVTGGTAPYTYAWARVSGSTGPAVSDATRANPTWSGFAAEGSPETAVWRLTVTDDASATATADITVHLKWTSLQ